MNIRTTITLAALSACALTATHAHAQGASVVRAFTGVELKYNRPLGGNPPTALSGVGNAVPYITQPFSVSVSGSYSLLFTATLNNGVGNANYTDTFLTIYNGAFNPASPLTNAIFANDDFSAASAGSVGVTLTAGVAYTFVGTTFNNGTYTGTSTINIGTVTRPVNAVVVIPEAGTLALILPAFGIVGAVIVRRRK